MNTTDFANLTDSEKIAYFEKEKEEEMQALLSNVTKENVKEAMCLCDSETRLTPFSEEAAKLDWTFEELLDIFSGADVPSSQPNFDIFYSLLEKLAPKMTPKMTPKNYTIFRGTSMETLEKHGPGLIWTEDKKVALQFANLSCSSRYRLVFGAIDKTPAILEMLLSEDRVFYAHTNGRGEQEIFLKRNILEDKDYLDYNIYNVANGGLT